MFKNRQFFSLYFGMFLLSTACVDEGTDLVGTDGSSFPDGDVGDDVDTVSDADPNHFEDGLTDSDDGSGISSCDLFTVDDCGCDPASGDPRLCCWAGATYTCQIAGSRRPDRPPTRHDFEYEVAVSVDNCESLPTCPLANEK